MARISRGWRLAKDSWALLRGDRSLLLFPLLSTLCATIALALTLTPGLIWSEAVDQDWIVLPFMAVGGFATTYAVVYFNVALAGAVRKSMDGKDTTLGDGLAVARERRGLILRWAIVQFLVGLLTKVAQYVVGDSVAGSVVTIVSGLAGAAWSVATFFVIPVLALEGVGPAEAMKRSVGLVRERWGEGLVGSAAIGLAVFVVAALPLMTMLSASSGLIAINKVAGAVLLVLTVIAFIAASVIGSALGVIFRVELYRFSTEGEFSGSYAEHDMIAAFMPPPRAASVG